MRKDFSAIEVYRRLSATKKMLLNKNQSLLYDGTIGRLSIDLPIEEDFYICPILFDDALFFEYMKSNESLFDKSNFVHQDIKQYIADNQSRICKSFSITAMLFTKYRRQEQIEKHVIICLGSLYHAPRVFYRDEKTKKVIYEKVPEYIDLY